MCTNLRANGIMHILNSYYALKIHFIIWLLTFVIVGLAQVYCYTIDVALCDT